MESILVCLVSIALLIVSVVTMTTNTVQSAVKLSDTWKDMQERSSVIQRTGIVSNPPEDYYGGSIELAVRNTGQVNISDFAYWDVIVEKQGASASYITYSPSYPPGVGQWTVKGIYISDNDPEVFDLNILNPGEEVVLVVSPGIEIDVGETFKITLATSDGITSQCYVTEKETPPSP